MVQVYRLYCYSFQFTTSQGGRRYRNRNCCSLSGLSIHDLTRRSTQIFYLSLSLQLPFNSRPHKEVDLYSRMGEDVQYFFQFTTSQGGRPPQTEQQGHWYNPFNSRPHKEVDGKNALLRTLLNPFNSRPHKEVDLSRHISTNTNELSIHDLTRRSTENAEGVLLVLCLSIHDLTRRSTISLL